MKKPSQVIKEALADPTYLTEQLWFCAVVHIRRMSLKITEEEAESADIAIEESLKGYTFLIHLLKETKVIPEATDYRDPVYSIAAHEHWNNLIERLEAIGK